VVRPVAVAADARLAAAGGVVYSPAPGAADAVLLGAREVGLAEESTVAQFTFEVLRPGDPHIELASALARDAANRPVQLTLGKGGPGAIPGVTALAMAGANPFHGQTAVELSLAHPGNVAMTLYSVDGRRVRQLMQGAQDAGVHRVLWDAHGDDGHAAAPGVYFLRVEADGLRFTRRLVLL